MIRQISVVQPLPDWRNLGVILRILVGANACALLAALLQVNALAAWLPRFVDLAAVVEPPLLAVVGLLAGLRDFLGRLPSRLGQVLVVAAAMGAAGLQTWLWIRLGLAGDFPAGPLRAALLGGALAIALLVYFDLRARAFSPAVAEARLAALNARIRPHFLFNSLNAVLSLIRAEPRRAEEALEALSDLFRAALRDPREGVPLSDEIALARQYLDLERLRLGERLQVEWAVADVPMDASIPPLMLQPLLENAVYHGVEPRPEGGAIRVAFSRRGEELIITITNPADGVLLHAPGNRMALANIRERLALYYDLEARLEIDEAGGSYLVRIILPCRIRNPRSPS